MSNGQHLWLEEPIGDGHGRPPRFRSNRANGTDRLGQIVSIHCHPPGPDGTASGRPSRPSRGWPWIHRKSIEQHTTATPSISAIQRPRVSNDSIFGAEDTMQVWVPSPTSPFASLTSICFPASGRRKLHVPLTWASMGCPDLEGSGCPCDYWTFFSSLVLVSKALVPCVFDQSRRWYSVTG